MKPPKYTKRAVVDAAWVSKPSTYMLIGLGAATYLTGQQNLGTAVMLGGIILYMQNEQLLPWQ